ncbi:hypothetical protein N7513_009494 [Penicillium frequentans]|nr:hypothetical protein N7513_009494 [Penicillium glabrum]
MSHNIPPGQWCRRVADPVATGGAEPPSARPIGVTIGQAIEATTYPKLGPCETAHRPEKEISGESHFPKSRSVVGCTMLLSSPYTP